MLVDKLMAYESNQLNEKDILELFAELIKNGMAWSLHGHYGRTAQLLIDGGFISKTGEIL